MDRIPEDVDILPMDTCVCGHTAEEHQANGTCMVENCPCAGYEKQED